MLMRDEIPGRVREIMGGHTARWLPREEVFVYFDGAERALEVFDVPLRDQIPLLQKLEPERPELHAAAGGPIVILFRSSNPTVAVPMSEERRKRILGG
jgi:hypothetical protein